MKRHSLRGSSLVWVLAGLGMFSLARADGVGEEPRGRLIEPNDFLVVAPELRGQMFWQPPVVIRRGGSYSGHWYSESADTPAVVIETSDPVVLEDCQIRSRSALIRVTRPGAKVTVRNCHAVALNPESHGIAHGRFLTASKPDSIVIERNLIEDSAGIQIDGAGMPSRRISIRFNRVRNIVGKLSNGMKGYIESGQYSDRNSTVQVQFVRLNRVLSSAVEIAWNEVINDPDRSRVEDNVAIVNSRGGGSSTPIRIHNNFIRGGFPFPSWLSSYSGGGIVIDGSGQKESELSAYVQITDNQIISTSNYGIGISSGYETLVTRNRVLGANRLTPGVRTPSANVGIYVRDYYGLRNRGLFRNHKVSGNVVGWHRADGQRNDEALLDCEPSSCLDVVRWSEDITLGDESDEYRRWQKKLRTQRVALGPSSDLCTPPVPEAEAQRQLWMATAPLVVPRNVEVCETRAPTPARSPEPLKDSGPIRRAQAPAPRHSGRRVRRDRRQRQDRRAA